MRQMKHGGCCIAGVRDDVCDRSCDEVRGFGCAAARSVATYPKVSDRRNATNSARSPNGSDHVPEKTRFLATETTSSWCRTDGECAADGRTRGSLCTHVLDARYLPVNSARALGIEVNDTSRGGLQQPLRCPRGPLQAAPQASRHGRYCPRCRLGQGNRNRNSVPGSGGADGIAVHDVDAGPGQLRGK